MRLRFPGIKIVGTHHGYFPKEGEESNRVVDMIAAARPNILFVCFGMPLQEHWTCRNLERLAANVILFGGSTIEYASGRKRARPVLDVQTWPGMALPPAAGTTPSLAQVSHRQPIVSPEGSWCNCFRKGSNDEEIVPDIRVRLLLLLAASSSFSAGAGHDSRLTFTQVGQSEGSPDSRVQAGHFLTNPRIRLRKDLPVLRRGCRLGHDCRRRSAASCGGPCPGSSMGKQSRGDPRRSCLRRPAGGPCCSLSGLRDRRKTADHSIVRAG